jgi:HD-like signal output (HDOD) protein
MTSSLPTPLEKLLLSPKAFPSMPRIAQELLASFENEQAQSKDISALIEIDPALSAKILRLANAPFYRQSRSVSTVADALAVVGFSTARALALGAIVATAFGKTTSLDMPQFWRISLGAASLAKHFSRKKGFSPELSFAAGVLHSLGELSMRAGMPGPMETFDASCTLLDPNRGATQRAQFGFDFAQAGEALANAWLFPSELSRCIGSCAIESVAVSAGPQECLLHICAWSARRSPFAPIKELEQFFPTQAAKACNMSLDELLSNPSASDLAAPWLAFIH